MCAAALGWGWGGRLADKNSFFYICAKNHLCDLHRPALGNAPHHRGANARGLSGCLCHVSVSESQSSDRATLTPGARSGPLCGRVSPRPRRAAGPAQRRVRSGQRRRETVRAALVCSLQTPAGTRNAPTRVGAESRAARGAVSDGSVGAAPPGPRVHAKGGAKAASTMYRLG